ncbi:MAG TPA: hypothetical protein LFV91_06255 [Rickettsia endosymbiont of Bembidion nr. Transversale]|nr:hypothetical protein [Rickettsia endosymbiont of Bembidion nr. Transversale]
MIYLWMLQKTTRNINILGIQKIIKNTNFISIFNWIPWSSHGMTPSAFFDPRWQSPHGMTAKNDLRIKPATG